MRSLRGFALSLKRVDAFEHQIMLFTRKKRGHRVYKGLLFSEISSCCRISNPFVWKMNIMRSTTNKSFRNVQGPDKQTPAGTFPCLPILHVGVTQSFYLAALQQAWIYLFEPNYFIYCKGHLVLSTIKT